MAFYVVQIDGNKYLAQDEKVESAVSDKKWAKAWSTQNGAEKAIERLKLQLKKHRPKVKRL